MWKAGQLAGRLLMTTRPSAALIMWPGIDDLVITPPVRAELAELVTLIDEAPIDLMKTSPADLERSRC
jgi:hypothetical protein